VDAPNAHSDRHQRPIVERITMSPDEEIAPNAVKGSPQVRLMTMQTIPKSLLTNRHQRRAPTDKQTKQAIP